MVDEFNVGLAAITLNQRIVTVDQQETATFALDGGHWIDAKISSGHSGTEMTLSLCGALAQRELVLTNGCLLEDQFRAKRL